MSSTLLLRSLIHRTTRRFGFQIRRLQPSLQTFLVSRNIDIVLDVGANEGQFGIQLRETGYKGHIVSFEPIAAAYEVLVERARRDGKWNTHNVALSDKPGMAPLNVSEHSVFSSFLPLRNLTKTIDPRSEAKSAHLVPVHKLDEYHADFMDRNCFLKVDTQGSERQVLLGAQKSLGTLLGIQLELSFAPLYEGEWTAAEALQALREYGFVPSQAHPVLTHPSDPQSWLQADVIFRRMDPTID